MPLSEVSIINDALGELGEDVITSRSDNTARANAADRFFDQARLELLEMHPWRFATKYGTCARLASAPAFKYTYAYQLPSDYVRLIEINETDVEDVQVPLYEKVGDAIYTDETSVKIAYVYDAGVSVFSNLAARALAFLMASKMARLLPDSASQKEEMDAAFKEAIRKAKAIDSMHQKQPIQNRTAYSSFIGAQLGTNYPDVNGDSSSY